MKIIIAPDSFKGCMSARQAAEAMEHGVHHVLPDAECVLVPMADGGEGTVQSLVDATGGTLLEATVTGPLGTPVHAQYGMLGDGCTAVIEMAAASGIGYVDETTRDPRITTTYGVGEVIKDAIEKGCRRFLVGIGGSATNDGGVGMLQALGFEFLDGAGKPVTFGAQGLEQLACIGTRNAMEELADCEFHIACDVKNVLCGPEGCSAVFGSQKGADDAMIRQMDAWLADYAALAAAACEGEAVDPDHPGAGAAGGLGFAFRTFLHGSLEPGVELILRETKLEEKIQDADVVVTEFCFCTPRICMHKCRALHTTITPLADKVSVTSRHISAVSRSCT